MHPDARRAAEWARGILERGAVVLDTETTGLSSTDEVVQVAAIDTTGAVLMDTLVRPTCLIPPSATRIHGITDAMVATAPPFPDVWAQLVPLLAGRELVIYNASYDRDLLVQSLFAAGVANVPPPERGAWYGAAKREVYGAPAAWHCCMLQYAAFVGEPGRYGDYRWQRLPGGDHSALGDVRATLAVLRRMAEALRDE